MAHVVRAWRSSRIIRWLVLFALALTVGAVYDRATNSLIAETSQLKTIGSLVSIDKLPEMASGEFCETDGPATKEAALEERQEFRAAALAARASLFTAPPPATPDTKDMSKVKPLRWIRDP